MRPFARLACYFRGHRNTATMKPEEVFGRYVYSRLYCSRCDVTFAYNPLTKDDLRRWDECLESPP